MLYNTQREKLLLPEYGRMIQQMVDICMEIADRKQRQRCAESIVAVMQTMKPEVRQMPDYVHKLWDQLAILSNYQLDIDYPFEVVKPEDIESKPKPMKYPMQRIRYRHYGHFTEEFMRKLKEMPESPERDELTSMMANYMKRSLYNYNRDAMDERKVRMDLENYSDGTACLPEDFRFSSVSNGHLPGHVATGKKKKKRN
ncbi:MAG: DUF4290 domain-containing protein [Bacteroidales bacterium]|nr:DUF4290 domain-containing protein [Bacteroidales bacterium]